MVEVQAPAGVASALEGDGLEEDPTRVYGKTDVVAAVRKLWESSLSQVPPKTAAELWKEHLEIRVGIGQIHRVQLAAGGSAVELPPNKRRDEDFRNFKAWAERVGIRFDGVAIAGGDAIEADGYGLVTTRALEPGERVIVVPRKAMMTLDLAKRSTFTKRTFQRDTITAKMDNVGLALFVAIQRMLPDSSWTPYFKILPARFYTPLHFSREELELLRGSPVFEEALLMYRIAARSFLHFHQMIARNDEFETLSKTKRQQLEPPPLYGSPLTVLNFTFDLYRWAMTVVSTRINLVPSEFDKDREGEPVMIPALIPALDMANHAPSSERDEDDTVMGVVDSQEYAHLITARKFDSAGEEVRSFYGRRSNQDFLLHNGFVPDGRNIWDKYRLKIGIPAADKHAAGRVAAAERLGFSDNGSRIYVFNIYPSAWVVERLAGGGGDSPHAPFNGDAPFTVALERFVRIFVADPPTPEVIDSPENEKKTATWLMNRFELLLRPYQALQSLDELAANLPAVYVNRLKMGEKLILEANLEYCRKWVADLERKE